MELEKLLFVLGVVDFLNLECGDVYMFRGVASRT
jgi:hypothetical protein